MPQFIVPQFIDVEDKIIGPITVRQFIMGVVAVLFIFLAYKLADTALFIIEAILIFGVYVLFEFVKINGQKFHIFLLSIIRSLTRAQLRVWNKNFKLNTVKSKDSKVKENKDAPVLINKIHPPKSTLSSLTLMVDTGGKYRPEEVLKKKTK